MTHRIQVLLFLFFFSALTFVERLAVAVVGPEMQRDLGLSSSQWGWVLGIFALSYGLCGVPAGALCDRIGPRLFVAGTTFLLAVLTGVTGLARSFGQLLSARFGFGACGAGALPSASATISRWFPLAERARAQGVVLMATRCGGILAPLVIVPIQRAYGWHAVFYLLPVIALAWVPAWFIRVRDNPADRKGISSAELAQIYPEGQPRAPREAFSWKQALSRPNLWWLMFMYHTYCWSAYFYLSWIYTFLEKGRAFSKADILAMSWLPFVCGAIANLLGGLFGDFLIARVGLLWGRRAIGICGLGLSALLIAAAALIHAKFACVVLLSLGFAASDFMNPTAWAVCLDIGGRNAGAVTGAMNMAGQIGSFLSAVVFGRLVDSFGNYDVPLVPIILLTGVSALAWFKIDPRIPLMPIPAGADTAVAA